MNLHDEIAQVAYELWEKRGKEHGKDGEDWYQAEAIVRVRYGQPAISAKGKEKKPSEVKKAAPTTTAAKATRREVKSPARRLPGSPRKS